MWENDALQLRCFTVIGCKCVTKLWQTPDSTPHNFWERWVIITARGLSSDWVKQGGTERKRREEGSGKGRGKTWLGWSPAQTLPWMEKEAFTFPIKRSFHHQTVYCLQNHSQITYSCCSSSGLLWTRLNSGVILSCVRPNICFVAPQIFNLFAPQNSSDF